MMVKKIIFIIPSIRHGGAELFLLRLCASISRLYKVSLIVIGKREGLYKEFEKIDLKIYYLDTEKKRHILKVIIEIRNIFISEKPDVIHSFLYISDIVSGIASLGLGIKLRVWSLRGTRLSHGTHFHKFLIQGSAVILSRFIPDKIISCSDQALEFHVEIGYPRKKIKVIWNFLSDWVYKTRTNSVFLTEQSPKIFSIGLAARYEEGKGHISLIDCAIKFLENNPNVNLVIKFAGKNCGAEGKLNFEVFTNPKVRKLVDKRRLSMQFSGLIYGSNLRKWYENIDLYFMASSALEAFPNSLAEAIAIGVPSLANPVGAAQDFLPQTQISLDTSSEQMFFLLMRFYSESVGHRIIISQNSKNRIRQLCKNDLILSEYIQIWDLNKKI
jgi:glycosyltransferase involved in cell wall biosynthesis